MCSLASARFAFGVVDASVVLCPGVGNAADSAPPAWRLQMIEDHQVAVTEVIGDVLACGSPTERLIDGACSVVLFPSLT